MKKMKTRNKDQNKSEAKDKKVVTKVKHKHKAELQCNRCRNHGISQLVKGHRCQYMSCDCIKCKDYEQRRKRRYELAIKKSVDSNASNNSSQFINSNKLVKKSIETSLSINSKTKDKTKGKTKDKSKTKVGPKVKLNANKTPSAVNVMATQEITIEEEIDDNIPDLVPQIEPNETQSQSTDGTIDMNEEPIVEERTLAVFPVKASPAVCAQYLKAGEELSRKLLTTKIYISDDEMMGCLKYSLITNCLGDVDMATDKIICALQEIRSGALYNIQHPNDDQLIKSSNADNQTPTHNQMPSNNGPLLNSTFNVNYYPKNSVNYSPAYTPN